MERYSAQHLEQDSRTTKIGSVFPKGNRIRIERYQYQNEVCTTALQCILSADPTIFSTTEKTIDYRCAGAKSLK